MTRIDFIPTELFGEKGTFIPGHSPREVEARCQPCTERHETRADARALWAVRVLDAWAEVGQEGCETGSHTMRRAPIGVWVCHCWEGYEGDQDEREWDGDSPDAARLAAAEAVWPELTDAQRAEIGPKP